MQEFNVPDAASFPAVLAAVQEHRVRRYLPAAAGDINVAFRFYLWNGMLSESFSPTMHYVEIVCRNAIHKALLWRGGEQWYENESLLKLLDHRYQRELRNVVDEERAQHGKALTANHVVSSMPFGFWDHLATKRFDRYLWPKGIRFSFPKAPLGKGREDLHGLIESVRLWRNRIAHHRAIFDKGPMKKHQDALELIGWTCNVTASWISGNSRVPAIVSLRPDIQNPTASPQTQLPTVDEQRSPKAGGQAETPHAG